MGRLIAYAWAAPATAVGLLAALCVVCRGASVRRVGGVLEVGGGWPGASASPAGRPRIVAITFGHVVLGRSHATLALVRAHELVHVRQYERWGIGFFPLYLASGAWQLLRGRDPYLDNHFEIEAFRAAPLPSDSGPAASRR